jgi:hypothetical protein
MLTNCFQVTIEKGLDVLTYRFQFKKNAKRFEEGAEKLGYITTFATFSLCDNSLHGILVSLNPKR